MTSTIDRPARKAIPAAVRRAVVERQGGACRCGCGEVVSARHDGKSRFDHEPALRLRDVNRRRTDYSPAQHHPDYIDALTPACHDRKTRGTGATTAGTDVGKIKKERKRERAIAAAVDGALVRIKQSLRGRPWPPKGSRPFRRKP